MSELVRFSEAIKDSKTPLAAIMPSDIAPKQCLALMTACIAGMIKTERDFGQLALLFGRGLALMRARPEILEASGYKSLHDYEQAEVVAKGLGSHGNVWKHKKVAERLPELSPEQILGGLGGIGIGKLEVAANALPENASQSQKREFVKQAKSCGSVAEFREWVETKSGVSAPGATRFDKIELMGRGDQITELKEYLADPGYEEWAGTDSALGKVLAAFHGTASEWSDAGLTGAAVVAAVAPVENLVVVVEDEEEEAEDGIPDDDPAREW